MKTTYICYARRTPIGKFGGALADVRPDDLLAEVFKDLKNWAPFPIEKIDDVITGCANQAGEDNRNISRMSAILAGFPDSVPATTLNRLCGSSMDALMDAVARISAGFGDAFVVGGVESMSRGPLVVSKSHNPFGRDHKMYDSSFGWRFENPKMAKMFELMPMGKTAEQIHFQYPEISREEQDQFALSSHQKAIAAKKAGKFNDEIIPIEVPKRKEVLTIKDDEGPREGTSLEKLSKLRPVFDQNGTVTAGNASSLNDGAVALLVVSEEFMKEHNLVPLAKITGCAVTGTTPNLMGLGPIHATRKLYQQYNFSSNDFDLFEINEAFAVQVLACAKELDIPLDKTNIHGGAIALGHPLGCSGGRIVTTLIHALKQNGKKKGLATMCIGVGQGIALSLEIC